MDGRRLKKLLDASPDMYLVIDREGVLADYKPSPDFEPVMPPSRFLGRPMEEILPDGLAEEGLVRIREVLRTGEKRVLEYSLSVQGALRHFEARFTLFDNDHVLSIIRDVTESKESVDAAQFLVDASPDLSILLDPHGTIVAINRSAARFYGKSTEHMTGTPYRDHLPPDQASVLEERLEQVRASGQAARYVDLRDERAFEAHFHPDPASHGAVRFVALFIREISERMQAQQKLLESEERYKRLFEENPVPMYIYDTDTLTILEANEAMIRIYGYGREELRSMTIEDIRPAEDSANVLHNVRTLRSRNIYHGNWRHKKKDGTIIDVEITSGRFPLQDRDSRLVLCNDVTEKLGIQRALSEREEQYRHLFEVNPLPMMIIDPENMRILNVNQSAVIHYGYSREEFLKLSPTDIRPAEDVADAVDVIRGAHAPAENVGIFRHMKKDGTVMLVDISSHAVTYEGQMARLVLCNDVTAQVEARTALEASETKFRSIVESSPMGIHMYHLDDRDRLLFSGANRSADRILGVDHSRFMGQTLEVAFPGLINTGIPNRYREVCLSGKPWHSEQVNYQDEKIKGAFEVYAFQTGPRFMSVLFLDVTEKKKSEIALLRSEEQLRTSLQEKEILLKEIHHRVKNNLQVVSGLLDLQANHINDPVAREVYKESQNRVLTMALIHEKLYRSADLSQVDFADYMESLCENLMVSYGVDRRRIELRFDTTKTKLVTDTAIPCGLIINELVTNALKHGFPGNRKGAVRLSFSPLNRGEFQLVVSDDGVGIPEELDIFRTETLGMQLVTSMVQQLGGRIEVDRSRGTTFTITYREYHEAGSVLY